MFNFFMLFVISFCKNSVYVYISQVIDNKKLKLFFHETKKARYHYDSEPKKNIVF